MDNISHLKRAVDLAGSQKSLAEQIGVQPQLVWAWIDRRNIPADYCPDIERVTKGAVTCEELRPDINWAVLRRSPKSRAAA